MLIKNGKVVIPASSTSNMTAEMNVYETKLRPKSTLLSKRHKYGQKGSLLNKDSNNNSFNDYLGP